jgi:serine O-acetyltransferase
MNQSLSLDELSIYVSKQLNSFFPDDDCIDLKKEKHIVAEALDRIEFCFRHVALKHYFNNNIVNFNHLYSDHYVMFIWYLSNSVYKHKGKCNLANKLYYLNKSLHGLDCMFDTEMPNIFLLFHSSGTMLGKAKYDDYFIALQGCTVGSQKGQYPIFGKGVSLTANSSVIGNSKIGNGATISTRTTIFQKDIPSYNTAYMNFETGQLQVKQSKAIYAQQFFIDDLINI